MPQPLLLLSTRDAARLLPESLVVIPVGSLEQHCRGPLGLDALIAEALSWRACLLLEARGKGSCVIAPTVYYGYSPEWARAPGTVSLAPQAMLGLVESVIEGLYRSGARRIALVNGHAGNTGILEAAMRSATVGRPGLVVGLVEYWRIAGKRLGHCGRGEEELARSLLYLQADCSCPLQARLGAARLSTGPLGEAGVEGDEIGLREAVEAVYRGLLEVLEARPGDPAL